MFARLITLLFGPRPEDDLEPEVPPAPLYKTLDAIDFAASPQELEQRGVTVFGVSLSVLQKYRLITRITIHRTGEILFVDTGPFTELIRDTRPNDCVCQFTTRFPVREFMTAHAMTVVDQDGRSVGLDWEALRPCSQWLYNGDSLNQTFTVTLNPVVRKYEPEPEPVLSLESS